MSLYLVFYCTRNDTKRDWRHWDCKPIIAESDGDAEGKVRDWACDAYRNEQECFHPFVLITKIIGGIESRAGHFLREEEIAHMGKEDLRRLFQNELAITL